MGTDLYLYHIEKWNQVKDGVVDEMTQKLFHYIEKEAKKKYTSFENNARYITDRLKKERLKRD